MNKLKVGYKMELSVNFGTDWLSNFKDIIIPLINIFISLFIPFISIVGIVITAILSYYFANKSKEKEIQKLFEIQQMQQAAKIAEFLALWGMPDPELEFEEKRKLNQMSFELSLYLPANIYKELAKILTYHNNAKNYKQILIEIRQIYKGKIDSLLSNEIIDFRMKK